MPDPFRRIQTIRARGYRWYDWGHRVMILIAREDGGSFDGVPRVRDLWFYREGGRIHTTRDYADVRARPDIEWKVFDSQNDGFEVVIGWWPNGHGGINQSGLEGRDEQKLFLRWFVWDSWIKAEWFGLRRWLYYKALHAVVHARIPFACQEVPDRNSGGYDHWHCQLGRRHTGKHRFNNGVWAAGGKIEHDPIIRGAS